MMTLNERLFRRIVRRLFTTGALAALIFAAVSARAQMCAAPPSGLVSWWRGDDTVTDTLGVNNIVAPNGVAFAGGKCGDAFSFNGSNAYLGVYASTSINAGLTGGFTFEAWINPADILQSHTLAEWSYRVSNVSYFGVNFTLSQPDSRGPGSLWVDVKDTSLNDHVASTAAGLLTSNQWQHIAITFTTGSGATAIYINGASVLQTNLGNFTPNTAGPLYMGVHPQSGGPYQWYAGLMDEISLYNRALSAAEIQNIYNAGALGKCDVAPYFVSQPQSLSASPGSNAIFTVTAGGINPLYYQWQFNGSILDGATNSTLSLTNVQPANGGTYAVVVTNLYGSKISSDAVLSISTAPPFILTEPPVQTTLSVGASLNWTVTATGGLPLNYQWALNGIPLPGATNSTLSLVNLQFTNSGTYSILVTNAYGQYSGSNSVLIVTPLVCVSPSTNLVGWWQAEGNTSDTVELNAAVAGGGLAYAPGEVGQAFSFNGSDAYVQVPASDSINVGVGGEFTIEAWINPSDISQPHLIAEWNDGDFGVNFTLSDPNSPGSGSLWFDVKDTGMGDHPFASPAKLITSNVWQHVAATYAQGSGVTTLYLNGNIIGQKQIGSYAPRTVGDFNLGARLHDAGAGQWFAGQMDEVSLYNRALSAAEIYAIYNAGTAGKCTSLILPPMLQVAPAENSVTLSWPVDAADCFLETTTNLVSPNWTLSYITLVTNNASVSITLPLSGSGPQQFYRLRHP